LDRRIVGKSASSFLFNEAVLFHESGALHEAVRRYQEVLRADPTHGDAARLLGTAYAQQGRFADAVALFRKAVKRAPRDPILQNLLGESLRLSGAPEEALKYFHRALFLKPHFAEAHANRGNALAALDRHDEAIASFGSALAERGNFAEVHINRGNSLRSLDRLEEAAASYQRAIAIRSDLAEAHFSLGLARDDQNRPEEAIESLDRALALGLFQTEPTLRARVFARRAHLLDLRGHFGAAQADMARSLALAPDDDEVLYTVSFIDLLHGAWPEGWRKFERRISLEAGLPGRTPASFPPWQGEPLPNELLVLGGERGLGDQIQFCSFAADLAKRGFRVAVVANPHLVPLLKTVPGVERVISDVNALRATEARFAHMMSVPHILHTTPESLPQVAPFLSADAERAAAWRTRLGTQGFKIGITWQGNPSYRRDKGRSLPLESFAPLAEIPAVRLISLQKRPGSEQIAAVDFRDRIETPLPDSQIDSDAVLDSAAVLANLDLVVSSDTMIPHLAGALGRPTFVALRNVPDWRWLIGRDDCPWYPSLRLFRQPAPGDWTSVFHRIAEAVRQLAAARSPDGA